MYAVIESGGKQHRVQPGDIIQVEKLEGEVGSGIRFDKVLFLSKMNPENAQVWLGKPYVNGAAVQAEIVGQGRGDKILIVKMKRRKQYRRTQGHRQYYTQLLVTAVDNGSGEKAALSDQDKTTKLNTFQSHLKPKGEAFTAKVIKTRIPAEEYYASHEDAESESAEEGSPEKKAAPAKSAGKKVHAKAAGKKGASKPKGHAKGKTATKKTTKKK